MSKPNSANDIPPKETVCALNFCGHCSVLLDESGPKTCENCGGDLEHAVCQGLFKYEDAMKLKRAQGFLP